MTALFKQFHTLIEIAIPIGASLASGAFTFMVLLVRYLKGQLQNGDGRSLRKAVDDLQSDFTDHRRDMRQQLEKLTDTTTDVSGRLASVESRLVRVETSGTP